EPADDPPTADALPAADDAVTAGVGEAADDAVAAGAAVPAPGGSSEAPAGAAGSFPEGATPYDVDSLPSGPIELPQEVAAAAGSGWFSSGPARPDVAQALCTDRDVRRINLGALQPVAAVHPYPLLFSSVAGSHLYGYPSRDSDVDLRGLHLLPAVQVVGLRRGPQTVERTWLHEEVPLDLVTHDAGKFFRLLLRHNGYVLEQLLSPLVVTTGPVHEELVALASLCLTRQHAEHYRTAAQTQWELFSQTGEARHVLATFRILLTGIQLVRDGQLVTHLPTLLETVPGAPAYLAELVEAKAEDEHLGAAGLPEQVGDDVVTLQAELGIAELESPLPEQPGAEGALHDLLVRLRLEGIPTWHL
ncbi:MAG TPA: nucleotidyltransferase domain-containing protein, partial [Kineosporiaceae bacterium]|nr:nucleotidyltransferase domain-containing protein [Kineosporiaceae bacterium]